MIYAVKLTMKDSDTGTSTTEKKLLISASNDSNAFDIIVKYCGTKLVKVTYFRMLGDPSYNGDIALESYISNSSNWT